MNSGHYADDVSGGGLGRGILIGVVVIFTALSFTLGFFVGKYSAPVGGSEVPIARVDEGRTVAVEPPAHVGQTEGVEITTLSRTSPAPAVVEEEGRQAGPSQASAPAVASPGKVSPKSEKPSLRDAPASRELKQKGSGSALDVKKKPGPEKPVMYTVQLGAFRGQAEAEQVKEKFDKKGFKTYITVVGSKGAKVYKVRTGEFADRKDAEVLSLRLKKTEGLTAFVTFRNE